MYKIEYLFIAKQDFIEIIIYIEKALKNKSAAKKLSKKITQKINQLADFPYMHPVFLSLKEFEHEYRKFLIDHYLVFYWVEEETKIITIARIVYTKRDYSRFPFHLLKN